MSLALLSDQALNEIRVKYAYDGRCPTCDGQKVYRLDGEEHECDCAMQIRLTKAYYNANIGRSYHSLGWDDFQSEDRDHLYPYMQQYVEKIDMNLRYGLGWTLSGLQGSGKTLLLCCVLKDLIKTGLDCYFVQGSELKEVFVGSNSFDNKAKQVLNERLRACQVLGVDDIATGVSDAHTRLIADSLESVVRYRYNMSLPTLITTNLTMEDEATGFPRVFSLLTAVNDWKKADGKDARSTIRRLRLKELRENNEVLPVV